MSSRPPNSTLQRTRAGRGRVQPPEMAAAHTPAQRQPADVPELGDPPSTAPARVRHWWRETARDMPQLSQRDRHAVLDYCFLLVEQESLRKDVRREGRFDTLDDGRKVPSGPYAALREIEKRLHAMRKDFAALAAHRARAKHVPTSGVEAPEPAGGGLSTIARLRSVT